jgi:hypothetical protein
LGLGQGVLEPTRQKDDLPVKQSEALEVVLHFIEQYGKLVEGVVRVAFVGGIKRLVRLRQAREGIGDPDRAVLNRMRG